MQGRQSRRKFLLSGVAAASASVAGCSSSDSPDDSSGGSGNSDWEEVMNTRVDVSEDDYRSWDWTLDQAVEVQWEMTVRSGPEVELFVMESTEFDEYQAGNRFYAIESEAGTSEIRTFNLDEGNLRIVLDNTGAGEVSPPTNLDDDVADVELVVDARPA